ncbi:hypothetical protein I317_07126 [Kwoniella heveanensis CBS 569]|uniref:Tyrosine specific protein phosphatases domain-containing protein n=1 Tax=Kwoniella heveanensis BCC8398 TaxID=1296120 RepID=A0A1B9GM30_9TREE|nr:hypothetical protein I316_06063 [Kwoniella heveanensis BCC8398]OCF39102.1 hypothetical protein I317_07126 [Kwoniella heveanensis CBS 569]
MSRAATATPPPQTYFPQRNTTPTMRHASAPTVTAAHFVNRHGYQHQPGKRRTKNLPHSSSYNGTSPLKKQSNAPIAQNEGLGLSFEDLGTPCQEDNQEFPSISRQDSVASYASSSSAESSQTSRCDLLTSEPASFRLADSETQSSTPSASMSSSVSRAPTQLLTPVVSEGQPLVVEQADAVNKPTELPAPPVAAPRASWVGKMAMAVVNTGMSMGIPFGQHGEKKSKLLPFGLPSASGSAPNIVPEASKPTIEELQSLSPEQQLARKREWAEAENRKVTECARLCSQWPQSGYNISKYGPNGAVAFYQPQSYANPHHVAFVMQRQAELERHIALSAGMFFSCSRSSTRELSDDESDPSSLESYQSSQASPTTSMSMSSDDALTAAMNEQKTAADIKAAMGSPLVSLVNLPDVTESISSLPPPENSPKSVEGARSLNDLHVLANSMALSKDDSAMEVDQSDTGSLANSADLGDSRIINRPARAQSCGAKRPLTTEVDEEEKRRKVDEAMVVEEAVETGVIMPPARPAAPSRMSSSVPDLSKVKGPSPPAVFGHVVKTSDTHPIIISPFFPSDLLPVLTQHLIMPPPAGPFSQTPLLLSSNIDVPSLLLSYVPSPAKASLNPLWGGSSPVSHNKSGKSLGNLLLSSCPGKRLRLDGPSRGRGPVCRDIATDLRRIKSEGVGCLVCCLDDAELALLGVPWETYREVAADTGLDVIRLPMPDGFTPVSLGLFDSQVTLIATKYTLQGTNVLVHCRGGVGRAGLTACAWAIKMGFVQPHPSLQLIEAASQRQTPGGPLPAELEHQIVMSVVERVIAMIRSRRGLKAIESFEQVQFLARYVGWLRAEVREGAKLV